MTASQAQVVIAAMKADGIAVAPSATGSWHASRAKMPDGAGVPDNWITVYDTGGVTDGVIQRTGEVITHPTVQIRIRSKPYNVGWTKGTEIRTWLRTLKRKQVTVFEETVTIMAALLYMDLVYLTQEEKNQREHFVMSVQLTLKEG